jgi:outer membrane protein OmpA-like peptidoglycan-associated protein
MRILTSKKVICASLCASLALLAGCSTVNPYTGQTETSGATIGTASGALGGAAIGALAGGGRGALIGGAVGALTGGLIGNAIDRQNAELRQRLVGTGVQVEKHGDDIQLIMSSDVSFGTAEASIRPDFYPTLDSVAVVLRKYDNTNVIVTGYTDNVGTAAYNQGLSEARARSVSNFLASRGVNPNRLFAEGMGKRDPIASNATAEGRAINRRVVITLRPKG